MTEQELQAIEERWKRVSPIFKDDISALLAEVRRLNRMTDKACETIIKVINIPAGSGLCPFSLDLIPDCHDECNDQFDLCWRKYLQEGEID